MAIIAENGLRIEGLCHRSHGVVGISGEVAFITLDTRLQDKLVKYRNNFDIGYLSNNNLKVNHFSNFQNFVVHDSYNLIAEEIFNNQGAIFAKNTATVGSRKKVQCLGAV